MTGLLDEFPALSKSKWRVLGFRFGICMLGFILGLPMTTRVRNDCIFSVFLLFPSHYRQCLLIHDGVGFFCVPVIKKIAHLITSHLIINALYFIFREVITC